MCTVLGFTARACDFEQVAQIIWGSQSTDNIENSFKSPVHFTYEDMGRGSMTESLREFFQICEISQGS